MARARASTTRTGHGRRSRSTRRRARNSARRPSACAWAATARRTPAAHGLRTPAWSRWRRYPSGRACLTSRRPRRRRSRRRRAAPPRRSPRRRASRRSTCSRRCSSRAACWRAATRFRGSIRRWPRCLPSRLCCGSCWRRSCRGMTSTWAATAHGRGRWPPPARRASMKRAISATIRRRICSCWARRGSSRGCWAFRLAAWRGSSCSRRRPSPATSRSRF